jgi:hypothetical protein
MEYRDVARDFAALDARFHAAAAAAQPKLTAACDAAARTRAIVGERTQVCLEQQARWRDCKLWRNAALFLCNTKTIKLAPEPNGYAARRRSSRITTAARSRAGRTGRGSAENQKAYGDTMTDKKRRTRF